MWINNREKQANIEKTYNYRSLIAQIIEPMIKLLFAIHYNFFKDLDHFLEICKNLVEET